MSSDPRQLPLWPIATLAVWLVCVAAGVLGLTIPYPSPPAETTETIPPTQLLDAQLTPEAIPPEPAPPVPEQAAPSVVAPTPAPAPAPLPQAPALVAVAPPAPAIAFALPTEGLTRVVEPAQASYARAGAAAPGTGGQGTGAPASAPAPPPPKPAPPAPPAPARLTLGEGEGQRIHASYPREAKLAAEQGTVGIRCTVEEDGHVSSVQVTAPSRWPALNQEAMRAVRETIFSPGPRRIYDVPIEFHLDR